MKKPLPIGVDNFKKIIKNHYYYVDKTMLIKELMDLKGEVNLFTRPRRFGKTLNLRHLGTISCAIWQNFRIELFWFIQVRSCRKISDTDCAGYFFGCAGQKTQA